MAETDDLRTQYRDAVICRYRQYDDPLDRYRYAKQIGAEDDETVTLDADMGARALAELHVDGWSYARIADAIGVSRGRVQQLVERGREVAIRLSSEH